MKKCSEYCGVACIDGSCPNALRNDDIDLYVEYYGTKRKTRCDYCGYNKGCDDCCIAFYMGISQDVCRKKAWFN